MCVRIIFIVNLQDNYEIKTAFIKFNLARINTKFKYLKKMCQQSLHFIYFFRFRIILILFFIHF